MVPVKMLQWKQIPLITTKLEIKICRPTPVNPPGAALWVHLKFKSHIKSRMSWIRKAAVCKHNIYSFCPPTPPAGLPPCPHWFQLVVSHPQPIKMLFSMRIVWILLFYYLFTVLFYCFSPLKAILLGLSNKKCKNSLKHRCQVINVHRSCPAKNVFFSFCVFLSWRSDWNCSIIYTKCSQELKLARWGPPYTWD